MSRPPLTRQLKNRLKAAFPAPAARYLQLKEHAERLRGGHLRRIFSQIHARNLWGDPESLSGPGSSLGETRAVREQLPALLRQLGVRSLLDAPCGDCYWIEQTPLDLDHYLGVDIVPEVIARDRQRLGAAGIEFAVADLTRDALPRADLILCRDCLIHFSFFYIIQAIRNFRRSGATYLLTTSYPGLLANEDILSGQWRPIDLQLPPFCLPAPLAVIEEKQCQQAGLPLRRTLALWPLADVHAL